MEIDILNTTSEKINLKLIRSVAEEFLKKYKKKKYSLSVVFVGDKKIKELNKNYRGIDKVTDILSFEGEDDFLGELIIDYNQIKKQAKKFRHSVKYELVFILVHGLLHLIGYDDETEKDRLKMIRMGEEFITKSKF